MVGKLYMEDDRAENCLPRTLKLLNIYSCSCSFMAFAMHGEIITTEYKVSHYYSLIGVLIKEIAYGPVSPLGYFSIIPWTSLELIKFHHFVLVAIYL